MPPPPVPANVQLPPAPSKDGNLMDLSFGKLTTQLEWMFESIDLLSKGLAQINKHLEASSEMWKRLESLENKPPPEAVTIVQERPKTPPPPPPPKIEIPYVPSEEERAEEARRAVRAMLDEEVAKLNVKIKANTARIEPLEEFTKLSSPWARMQQYFQEIGFLPFGEPEEKDPLVLMGQVFVLFRQGIDMCPKIKDLEDAKDTLNARITEVESTAATDREARSKVAAAASAKIREDLTAVDKVVQGLVRKNEEDGDVAGGLRDVVLRVDNLEERRFPKLELRVRKLEDAEHTTEEVVDNTRSKGFLETLAEVDLPEEVRRLRTIVECMEAAMPYETRQTMQFFRESGGAGPASGQTGQAGQERTQRAPTPSTPGTGMAGDVGGGGGGGGLSGAGLNEIRDEIQQQLERFRQKSDREQQNMLRNLNHHEKSVEKLESQMMDMWKKLPKVLAVLEPLQAQLEMFMDGGPQDTYKVDSTGGPGTAGGPGISPTSPIVAPLVAVQNLGAGAPAPGTGAPAPGAGTPAEGYARVPSAAGAGAPIPSAVPSAGGAGAPIPSAVPSAGGAGAPIPNATVTGATARATVPSTPPGWASRGAPVLGTAQPQAIAQPVQTMARGFTPLPEGAAGTGEGGAGPSKDIQFSPSPVAQMGSLTGLIKVALQSTTNQIHLNLHQDMLQFRSELLSGLDGKANKSELLALASRLDAWAQKGRTREKDSRFRDSYTKERELSPSPRDQAADTTKDSLKFSSSAPPGKLGAGAASPSQPDKKKTCHEKCKEPTAPRSIQMTQSLNRLPALKT